MKFTSSTGMAIFDRADSCEFYDISNISAITGTTSSECLTSSLGTNLKTCIDTTSTQIEDLIQRFEKLERKFFELDTNNSKKGKDEFNSPYFCGLKDFDEVYK